MFGDSRLPDRFWRKVSPEPNSGCWLWTGYCDPAGYGRVGVFGRASERVHRVTYRAFVGPISSGLEIDHLCRVRACCNPQHLEAVEHRINVLRGRGGAAENAAKVTCKRGHPFDETNTVIYVRPSGRTFRSCRACWKHKAQRNQPSTD